MCKQVLQCFFNVSFVLKLSKNSGEWPRQSNLNCFHVKFAAVCPLICSGVSAYLQRCVRLFDLACSLRNAKVPWVFLTEHMPRNEGFFWETIMQ